MWKRIAIFISALFIAVVILLFYLNNQFEKRIIDFAKKQGIELSKTQIETNLFSSSVKLKNIHYPLGNTDFNNLNIELNGIDIDPDSMRISAVKNHLSFNFNDRPYHIFVEHLALTQRNTQQFAINAQQTKINESTRFNLQGHVDNAHLHLAIQDQTRTNETGHLDIQQTENAIIIHGSQLDTDLIQGLLNTPILIQGKSDLTATIQNSVLSDYTGKLTIKTHHGVINHLNLFNIIGQYLPINWDNNKLSQHLTNTPFDAMESEFTFDKQRINVQRNTIIMGNVIATGQGQMQLATMQCDFIFNITSKAEKYPHFTLPIHFYDDCRSPQYNIELNKSMRAGLKQLIKEKFLH